MIKWAELIPIMRGNYAIGLEGEGGDIKPCLYDTKAEVLAEIEDMNDSYQFDIEAGERDEGDEWEGECHQVLYTNTGKLFLLDDHQNPVEEIDWRAQL